MVLSHLIHHTIKTEKRAINNPHIIRLDEFDLFARSGGSHVNLLQKRLDLVCRQGCWLGTSADKARDLRCLFDHLQRFIDQRGLQLHNHISREKLPSRRSALAILDLNHILRWHEDLSQLFDQPHLIGPFEQAGFHPPLKACVGMNDVPILCHALPSNHWLTMCHTATLTSRYPTHKILPTSHTRTESTNDR